MTLKAIVQWLKTLDPALDGCIAAGGIDGNQEKFVGVYDAKSSGTSRICMGGKESTVYDSKQITLLIHWTKSEFQAEAKAQELWEKLYGLCGISIGEIPVISVDPGNGPTSVGKDAYGICEYVINMKI